MSEANFLLYYILKWFLIYWYYIYIRWCGIYKRWQSKCKILRLKGKFTVDKQIELIEDIIFDKVEDKLETAYE